MRNILGVFIVIILLGQSCENKNKIEKEIANIDVNIHVERFDKLFAEVTPESLPELKMDYPFMFSKSIADSVWVSRIQDTLQQQLFFEIERKFEDTQLIEDDITQFFQHLKYYNKTFREPRVITFSDYVDYRNKIFVTDTIALIAIDTYLGSDHEFYGNIQKYLKQKKECPMKSTLRSLVRRMRLELTRRNRHYPLKVACIPISPPALLCQNIRNCTRQCPKQDSNLHNVAVTSP